MSNRYNTGNPRPSNSMKDLNDNALAYDDFMLSEEGTFVDRLGNRVPTLKGLSEIMSQAGESVVEKTRQNLIPLSRQYMTLADAQADITNIPAGSATYYRSPDESSLAIEVINKGGMLTPTGRQMPSQFTVESIVPGLIEPGVNLFNKNTVTRGYYLFDGTGVPTVNPLYCYSERIKIIGGGAYTTGVSTRVATFYDKEGKYLSDLINVNSFTAPLGAAYFVASILLTNLDVYKLNFGAGEMPYTDYQSVIRYDINDTVTNGYVALGFKPGKNLFNPAMVMNGVHLSSIGTVYSDGDYSTSVTPYIAVTPEESLCINQQWKAAAYYNSKGEFISRQLIDGYGSKPIAAFVFPEDTAYVRIEFPAQTVPITMVEKNDKATEFEAFKLFSPDNVNGDPVQFSEKNADGFSFKAGTNLFNKNTAHYGYINEWGSVYPVRNASGTDYVYSEYIPVNAGVKYKSNLQMRFIAFYDASKKLLSTTSLTSEFIPAQGVEYVRVTIFQTNKESMFLAEGNYLGPSIGYQHQLVSVASDGVPIKIPGDMVLADDLDINFVQHGLLVSGKNLYNKNTRKSGYIDEQGVIHEPDSRYYYSDYIPVTPGAKYAFNSDSRFVAFYARNKGFISSLSDTGQHIRVITTPVDCYFVRITTSVAISDTFQMEAGEVSTAYEEFTYSLLSTMPDGTPVTGGGAAPEDTTVPDSYGLERLRETHMRLNKLTYGGNVQFSWAMIGDSYTRGQVRYALKCSQKLWHLYNGTAPVVSVPPIGFGYRSFGYDQYGDNTDIIGTEITQTGFACQYNTGFGLDISSVSSATVGATISWNDDFSLGFAYTLYAGGGSGVISYNAPGMTAPVEIDLSTYPVAVQMIPMSAMPTAGSGTVTITVISGSVVLYGVRIQKETQPGVIVHKLGGSGSHTNNWVNADETRWETAFTTLKANLATIMLGTNDQGIKLAPETFKSNLLTMINRIRTASPTTDIMLICPAENNRPGGNAIPMSSYARKMYELALEQDVAFLNLQSSFGVNPADYAYGSARPWMVSDGLHPDPDTGGYAIAAALMRSLSLPMV
ncbi:SGNH/GDSL hydrolase family protein [Klebsiella pneumoniae]|nr:SGNH/GDSL hydrolase family protein [Klebsiella pneumoniae]